jgi:hypothetical protein
MEHARARPHAATGRAGRGLITEETWVSDEQTWQPPEGAGAPGHQGGQGPQGAPGQQNQQPGYGPGYQQGPGYGPGHQQPGYGYQNGWTPPPKPGLIPLRPLTFGTLIGAPFQVLRRNPKATFGSALLIQAVVVLVSLLVVGGVTAWAVSRITMADPQDVDAIVPGSIASIILAALVPAALSLIGSALLQGVIVTEVARGTLGEKLPMRALWRGITGRRGALIGWMLLITAAVIVALAVLTGIIVLLVLLGPIGIVFAVLTGIFGILGLLVLWFWLSTKLSLVPSAIVLERAPLGLAVRRSWALTHRFFWRTFGVEVLIGLICYVATQIVTAPVTIIYTIGAALIDPTGSGQSNGGAIVTTIVSYVVMMLLSLVIGSITSIVQSAATALIYLDLRMRKEGLDLQLSRFVEDRQAGRPSADPFPMPSAS